MLRDYQQRAIDDLYQWFNNNPTGNPCLVLPTGAGKSHVVAALCKNALQNWPSTRVLMLTHVKELIEQNAEKMRLHWPNAPMGVYSAGLRKRELGHAITFAGIQSVQKKALLIGHIDLIIIDECHLVSHKDEGGYRTLISKLKDINPALRVIGLTATPFRLGHGYITDGDALFDDLIEPVSIVELVYRGFLSPVRSKLTDIKIDASGIKKRAGEYVEKDLQAAVNKPLQNEQVVSEVIKLAGNRKAWLFFCTGVAHAEAIAELLNNHGIVADCVTGSTPAAQRDDIINRYKAGKIKALTNANVLTTGFDYPDIDLIVMLRPTLSPTLYVQMVGRGMRLKSHADHCLVLDFVGCVQAHGPITAVRPPKSSSNDNKGESPSKACPQCDEIVHLSARTCSACGFEFPKQDKTYELHDIDIMGTGFDELEVTEWNWDVKTSRKTGIEMLFVTYYGYLSDKPVSEYLTVMHDAFAGQKARRTMMELINGNTEAAQEIKQCATLYDVAGVLNTLPPPSKVAYIKNGKFFEIKKRIFDNATK